MKKNSTGKIPITIEIDKHKIVDLLRSSIACIAVMFICAFVCGFLVWYSLYHTGLWIWISTGVFGLIFVIATVIGVIRIAQWFTTHNHLLVSDNDEDED